jgi:hypothetical protein
MVVKEMTRMRHIARRFHYEKKWKMQLNNPAHCLTKVPMAAVLNEQATSTQGAAYDGGNYFQISQGQL